MIERTTTPGRDSAGPTTPAGDPGFERSAPGSPDGEPLVLLEGVSRALGRRRKRLVVLDDVSLAMSPGTAMRLEGANGAGKTTLLRIITGILSPDRGTVQVDGIDSTGDWHEYHRRIGFLSAGDRGLFPRLSVGGHLDYVTRISLLPKATRVPAIASTLELFNLTDLIDRRVDRMSQGQRQRLRLALTFVHEPKVLLLDEPRNSLDAAGLDILAAATQAARARGAAVIWACPVGEPQPVEFDDSAMIANGQLTLSGR